MTSGISIKNSYKDKLFVIYLTHVKNAKLVDLSYSIKYKKL